MAFTYVILPSNNFSAWTGVLGCSITLGRVDVKAPLLWYSQQYAFIKHLLCVKHCATRRGHPVNKVNAR